MFGYSPAGAFPRRSYEERLAPPSAAQGTSRPSYTAGARLDQSRSVGRAASNQMATGLDALNLSQKDPEVLSAAWNAFLQTLNNGPAAQHIATQDMPAVVIMGGV
ncbi:hypothetical protein COOONC_08744 [Cooperia oncophora]